MPTPPRGDVVGCDPAAAVVAGTLAKAYGGARQLEWMCEVWLRASAVGTPALLEPEQVADVVDRMSDYGQPTAAARTTVAARDHSDASQGRPS